MCQIFTQAHPQFCTSLTHYVSIYQEIMHGNCMYRAIRSIYKTASHCDKRVVIGGILLTLFRVFSHREMLVAVLYEVSKTAW